MKTYAGPAPENLLKIIRCGYNATCSSIDAANWNILDVEIRIFYSGYVQQVAKATKINPAKSREPETEEYSIIVKKSLWEEMSIKKA